MRCIRSANWDPEDPEAAIGGIVAVVSLVDVCTEARAGRPCDCGDWALPGSFHWRLARPRPLAWPVLTIGQPGLWELAPRVAADVARLLPGPLPGSLRSGGERAGQPPGADRLPERAAASRLTSDEVEAELFRGPAARPPTRPPGPVSSPGSPRPGHRTRAFRC